MTDQHTPQEPNDHTADRLDQTELAINNAEPMNPFAYVAHLLEAPIRDEELDDLFDKPIEDLDDERCQLFLALPDGSVSTLYNEYLRMRQCSSEDQLRRSCDAIAAWARRTIQLSEPFSANTQQVIGAVKCLAILHHCFAISDQQGSETSSILYNLISTTDIDINDILIPFHNYSPQVLYGLAAECKARVDLYKDYPHIVSGVAPNTLSKIIVWMVMRPHYLTSTYLSTFERSLSADLWQHINQMLRAEGLDPDSVAKWRNNENLPFGTQPFYDGLIQIAQLLQLRIDLTEVTEVESKGASPYLERERESRARESRQRGSNITAADIEISNVIDDDMADIPIDDLLGAYLPEKQMIILWIDMISVVADVLKVEFETLRRIVELHECAHAVVHLARDADGYHFSAESLAAFDHGAFPSSLHETLAQLLCYRCIENDSQLHDCFQRLNERQYGAYISWQGFRAASLNDVRHALVQMRRGRIAATFDSFRDIIDALSAT